MSLSASTKSQSPRMPTKNGFSSILVYLVLVHGSLFAFKAISILDYFPGMPNADFQAALGNKYTQILLSINKNDWQSELTDNNSFGKTKSETFWNPVAKRWLTEEQVSLLLMAFDIGFSDGDRKHAQLVQATLLQETIAGQMGRIGHMTAPVGKRSYGVMQVKVSAARDVLYKYPSFGKFSSSEELLAELITNDEFNIMIASKYLLFLRNKVTTDAQALLAYNRGLKASRQFKTHNEFRYVKGVKLYSENIVIPFNKKYRSGYSELSPA